MTKSTDIVEFIKKTNAYTELCFDKNLVDYPTQPQPGTPWHFCSKNILFLKQQGWQNMQYLTSKLK